MLRSLYLKSAEELEDPNGQIGAYNWPGSCVMIAGPGSGKTKTLTTKMARILTEDLRPYEGLACITYSAECARELKHRMEKIGVREGRRVFIGTVHSFCLQRLLRPFARLAAPDLPSDFLLAKDADQTRAYDVAATRVLGNRAGAYRMADILKYRQFMRDDDAEMGAVAKEYESCLHAAGYIDFDDMAIQGLRLVRNHAWIRNTLCARYPVLVIDEYQDLSPYLHQIVMHLHKAAGIRLIAVGDPDQSIYPFQGARPELLAELCELPTIEVFRLKFNYRCAQQIIDASTVVLAEPREYTSRNSGYGTLHFHPVPEGLSAQAGYIHNIIIPNIMARREGLLSSQIGILYPNKNSAQPLADCFDTHSVSYIRIDSNARYPKTPFTRWIEDCAARCSIGWHGKSPRISDLVGTFERFLGRQNDRDGRREATTLFANFLFSQFSAEIDLCDWLEDLGITCLNPLFELYDKLAENRADFELLLRLSQVGGSLEGKTLEKFAGQAGASDHLNLITLHSAKGREFDVVVMLDLEQGQLPSWSAKSGRALAEARRLFYVGVTRAKYEVHFVYSGFTVDRDGRRRIDGPSQFVDEIRTQAGEL